LSSRDSIEEFLSDVQNRSRIVKFSTLGGTVPFDPNTGNILDVQSNWGPGIVFWHAIDCAGAINFEHTKQNQNLVFPQSFGPSQRGSFWCDGSGGTLTARVNFLVNSTGNGAVNAQSGFVNTSGTAAPQIRAAFFPASEAKRPEEGGWNQALLWNTEGGAVATSVADGSTTQLAAIPGFNRRVVAYTDVSVQWDFVTCGATPLTVWSSPQTQKLDEAVPPGLILQIVNQSGAAANVSMHFLER